MREYINIVEGRGITDSWFKDGSFRAAKKAREERYRIADEPGTIDTLEGPVKYLAGFYIMTGPKGEEYPISPETFRKMKDDQGDGIAIPKPIEKLAKIADHDGSVDTSWGEKLNYTKDEDVIVRHGENDYGVVKRDIFATTYEKV